MAYQPMQNYDNRSPPLNGEPKRQSWMSHPQPYHHHHPSVTASNPVNVLDPESEDSDVSNPEGDIASAFALPISLPPAPSKQAMESPETISTHLHELERVEDHNVKKHNRLKDKRKRKDERIARKRAIQDEKIKAIMEARVRRDSRISLRREREDIAFTRFYETLEEEETRLRQRLKRLKRGLPVDDPTSGGRRVSEHSITSMSPRAPTYSTIPPPAKRHQTSHPSQAEYSPHGRGPNTTPYPAQPLSHPSYQFYPSHQHPSPSNHYHPSPVYPPAANAPVSQTPQGDPFRHELPPYGLGGQRRSPHLSTAPPTNSAPSSMPPRHPSTSYDTRPPPPLTSSGFATINQPTPSGFAAVNSKSQAATPSVTHAVPTPIHASEQQGTAADQTPSRDPPSEDRSATGGNGSGKRTPSTTHPYQMSEAFANRHHHCERVDSLNRGIWTWYGHAGTQENPTTIPAEMYLKCNHDDCGRIDWRTVHGLQCHIVKNHEQPKGTIGSLEKALERYGVPVKYIEEIEKRDGLGTGGTMADPKNTKIKSRMKETGDRRDFGRRDYPSTLQKVHRSFESGSPSAATPTPKADHGTAVLHRSEAKLGGSTFGSPTDVDKKSVVPPTAGFAAINSSWQVINSTPVRPLGLPGHESNHGQVQAPVEVPYVTHKPPTGNVHTPFWPSWQAPRESLQRGPQTSTEPILSPPQQSISHETPAPSIEAPSAQPEFSETKDGPITAEPVVEVDLNANQKNDDSAKEESGHDATLENKQSDVQMTENAHDAQDATMTGVNNSKDTEQADMEAPIAAEQEVEHAAQEEPAQHAPVADTNEDHHKDGPTHKNDVTAPTEEPLKKIDESSSQTKTLEEESMPTLKSPEPTHKRVVHSRRGSRRSSMATSNFGKVSTERAKEEDTETVSTVNTASKVNSDDEDSDSITVATKPTTDRRREMDKSKDVPKRLPNGRFLRRGGR